MKAEGENQEREKRNEERENSYPVLCAWCLKEGKRTVLKRVDYPNSHGICPRHAAELVEQSRAIARALCRDIAQEAEPEGRREWH